MLEYKLIDAGANGIANLRDTILHNRGIHDTDTFLGADESCCLSYSLLDNIDRAAERLIKHMENNSNIHIVVDSDADGICSAAMLYQYIKKHRSGANIGYSLHTGKQHGLSEDIVIPKETNLIILPDAGSNDYEQHRFYSERGIDVIVLDHHEAGRYSEDAIVVNNQLSERYPNKALCGAGVTYKFLQALDDELWRSDADAYLDLVAVANIGDMMDSRSLETRYYMSAGLKKLRSEALIALYNKVSDKLGGRLTITGAAFYIIPLINAMIRLGSQEQKEILFRAFCGIYSESEYVKRDKSVTMETVYDRAARECVNAKSRQKRLRDSVTPNVCDHIESRRLTENKVIICNVDDLLTREMTGVVCSNIAERYRRPVLLYRTALRETEIGKTMVCEGSGRNYGKFELEDFRGFLKSTNLFNYVDGHSNAFGFSYNLDNMENIIEVCNRELAKYKIDYTHKVDFTVRFEELDDMVFYEADRLQELWGQKVEEPQFAILDIDVELKKIEVSKNGAAVKFEADGITFIRFTADSEDILLKIRNDWEYEGASVKVNVVGKLGISSYGGVKSRQVIVSDWAVSEKNKAG